LRSTDKGKLVVQKQEHLVDIKKCCCTVYPVVFVHTMTTG